MTCQHEFPPEKIYKDGKLHRDSSNACFHECSKCHKWINKFETREEYIASLIEARNAPAEDFEEWKEW